MAAAGRHRVVARPCLALTFCAVGGNAAARGAQGDVNLFSKFGKPVLQGVTAKVCQNIKDPVVAHDSPSAAGNRRMEPKHPLRPRFDHPAETLLSQIQIGKAFRVANPTNFGESGLTRRRLSQILLKICGDLDDTEGL